MSYIPLRKAVEATGVKRQKWRTRNFSSRFGRSALSGQSRVHLLANASKKRSESTGFLVGKPMSNVQHSSRSNEWYSPEDICEAAKEVLGDINFDPFSCEAANSLVKARQFLSLEKGQDGFDLSQWPIHPVTVYCNPPGGKQGNKSQTVMAWDTLMRFRELGLLRSAIFMGFSLEHLSSTQQIQPSMCNFPFVIPAARIRFIKQETMLPNDSPTHANVIVYVPGIQNDTVKFWHAFEQFGSCMSPAVAG